VIIPKQRKHFWAECVTIDVQWEVSMRTIILAALLVGFTVSAHATDDKKPAGGVKGAAVGAAAGHEVGSGHAVAGAATGAAIGHHQTKKAEEAK
jgi:outer membrane lipoprotein SlyB